MILLGTGVLVPPVFGSGMAFALADQANLRWHGQQLELYRLQHKNDLPTEGGHKFVLATWIIADKTVENFDRYFTPGRRDNDPHYRERRVMVGRGEDPWPEL